MSDLATCTVPSDWAGNFSQCLYEWQGLEAGGLALLAALLGAWYIWKQIKQSDEHHSDEIRRRHNAARVALPLALSEVSAYVQAIADNGAGELEKYEANNPEEPLEELARRGFEVEGLPAVRLPTDVIPAFQAFVETLEDEREVRHVGELLSSIQILKSRYDSLNFNEVAMEMTLYSRLLDAAKVGYLNDQLYNYGRFLEDESFAVVGVLSIDDAWEKIHAKSNSLIFTRAVPDFFFGSLKKPVDGYKKSKVSPWLERMEG